MFDQLGQSLQRVFRNPRGFRALSDRNVQDALREVRMALLEADVHYVARSSSSGSRPRAWAPRCSKRHAGAADRQDRPRRTGGPARRRAARISTSAIPAEVMLLGLHGSGKTTTCGKLARLLEAEGQEGPAGRVRHPPARPPWTSSRCWPSRAGRGSSSRSPAKPCPISAPRLQVRPRKLLRHRRSTTPAAGSRSMRIWSGS